MAPEKVTTRTYTVKGMRVLLPSDKTKEKNPDLLFTVSGKFFAEDGSALTIPQKAITVEMREHVKVDMAKGTLTVPAGQRGAPKRASATQDEINALLGVK
jgi:hypothetical protein